MKNQNKIKSIVIRFSADEFDLLHEIAKKQNITLSSLILTNVMENIHRNYDTAKLEEVLASRG